MKVLMISRASLFSSPGGDTIQIEGTAKYLRKLGVDVDVKLANEPIDYLSYDLLHFFNIIRPADILLHIRKSKKPYVVSTIYVDYSEFEAKNRKGILRLMSWFLSGDMLEYIKTVARAIKNGEKINSLEYLLLGQRKSIKKVVKFSKYLLPNSVSEYNRLSKDYYIQHEFRYIPNAIDTELFNNDAIAANEKYKNAVICVGRIEGRKNQLNLVRAIKDTGLDLYLIGKPSPNNMSYFELCQKEAEGHPNVSFLNHIDQKELVSIYKAAKVHVLPSWFETTGLSSLEAAVCNCNIVVTSKGDTQEYFKDFAYYCEPDDIVSIRKAVMEAHSQSVKPDLRQIVLENYNWAKAAEETLMAYNKSI